MSDLKLGTLLNTNLEYERDAIHIAVAPVVAGEDLEPAEHVGFIDKERTLIGKVKSPIGVIDPFLSCEVKKGQKCWLFLYQNTITSLRHEWSHPLFGDLGKAVAWLKAFADEADLSYGELLAAADAYLKYDAYLCEGGKWEGFYMPDDFWNYYQTVSGELVPEDKRGSFFSCSC